MKLIQQPVVFLVALVVMIAGCGDISKAPVNKRYPTASKRVVVKERPSRRDYRTVVRQPQVSVQQPKAVRQPPVVASQPQMAAANRSDYQIGVDDMVTVNVWKNEDLSIEVPVRPDGKISVPLIGDVVVGGKTPAQVSGEITQRLSTYLRDPKVTVILSELRSHEFLSRVRVTGAVEKPVSLPYRQGMTVLDAVLEAGGITRFASADGTKIYRKQQQGSRAEVKSVKLNRILKKGDLSSNYMLMPGDVVTVPERFF